MNEKLESSLLKEFPGMFDLDYGFAVGDGWYKLIRGLCKDIYPLYKQKPFKVIQIKQKFGGLRFYIEPPIKEVQEHISLTESLSLNTCESCGDWGDLRVSDWLITLCDKCAKEYKLEKKAKKITTKIGTYYSPNKPKK